MPSLSGPGPTPLHGTSVAAGGHPALSASGEAGCGETSQDQKANAPGKAALRSGPLLVSVLPPPMRGAWASRSPFPSTFPRSSNGGESPRPPAAEKGHVDKGCCRKVKHFKAQKLKSQQIPGEYRLQMFMTCTGSMTLRAHAPQGNSTGVSAATYVHDREQSLPKLQGCLF